MSKQFTLSLPDSLYESLLDYQKTQGFKSIQEAAKSLLDSSLSDHSINDRLDSFESKLDAFIKSNNEWARDLELSMIKTTSKGTKASLANLIALSTLLPPIGNVVDDMSYLNSAAWQRLGFEIDSKDLNRDQAALLMWKGRGAPAFLNFCWSAAGRASRHGAYINYNDLTKDLLRFPETEDDRPAQFVDLLEDETALIELFGQDFVARYTVTKALNERVDAMLENGSSDGLSIDQINEIKRDYEDILEEIRRRRDLTISRSNDEPFRLATFDQLGLEDPFIDVKGKEGERENSWEWLKDNLSNKELVEHLSYRKEQGYEMPTGYDGSLDSEIGE